MMFCYILVKTSFFILRWILEASWRALGATFGGSWGAFWEAFEPLGAHLGGSWALLGATLEVLGPSWAPLWSFLVPLGVHFCRIVVFLSGFGSRFQYMSCFSIFLVVCLGCGMIDGVE